MDLAPIISFLVSIHSNPFEYVNFEQKTNFTFKWLFKEQFEFIFKKKLKNYKTLHSHKIVSCLLIVGRSHHFIQISVEMMADVLLVVYDPQACSNHIRCSIRLEHLGTIFVIGFS